MTTRIDKIEGLGSVSRKKLESVGIGTTDALLEKCGPGPARRMVAAQTGLREEQLLKWVNAADLMRLAGVDREYSQLLEAAGVDTVKELKRRSPQTLCEKLQALNETMSLARRTPALHDVSSWIHAAQGMEQRVFQ
jgi:predicted RecB family nuclease